VRATRELLAFLRPYRLWATLAPLLMLLEVAMDLLQPRLIARIIDSGIARGDLGVVAQTGGIMVGVAFIGLLGGVGCTIYAIRAAASFGADLRAALFARVQALSFANLDTMPTGNLITRLTNDVTQVQELVALLLRTMVRTPLLLFGSLFMALLTDVPLSLIFVVLIPIIVLALSWIIGRTYPLFGQVQLRLDSLNVIMQENLAGVRVVKAFARSAHEIGRFGTANDALLARTVTAVRTSAVTMPAMLLILNAGVVTTLWFGGGQVAAGRLQAGELIAFINYLMQALNALIQISVLVSRLARSEASAERLRELLHTRPALEPPADPRSLAVPRGRLAFEGVSFSYGGDGHDPVLRDVSFVAEPGQTVAILGATGAGKSSLVGLIPRFYDPTAGRITIDGIDVRDLDEGALRATVGIAMQESVLFSGTIRDNIRYGRPEASEEEVRAAAEQAQAHDFIMRLPGGYDATVGQRGVNLSGGQKQRLAIARALLPRPAILILDDSTSAVDVATEARIRAALAANDGVQTRLIVAQRISSARGRPDPRPRRGADRRIRPARRVAGDEPTLPRYPRLATRTGGVDP
jgi:ATP-binding cassette subfamily B multidrug efflux pump